MSSTTPPELWTLPELQRARRAIVVVDVVESVRLMQEDESGFIDRWRHFVHTVRTEVLPKQGGRLVKSLGDGMLLEFASVRQASAAALALQALANAASPAWSFALRAGLHEADVTLDALDVYGQGVNLAARLASLAEPGGIAISDQARDQLIDGFDAQIEDMGLCYVKHLEKPLRVFRLASALAVPAQATHAASPLRPTIAVLPLLALPASTDATLLARVLADDIVASLARCRGWRVISALSLGGVQQHDLDGAALAQRVGADYALSGSLVHGGDALRVTAHLSVCGSGEVVWSCARSVPVDALLSSQERLATQIAHEATDAALSLEWRSARHAALPSLRGYTLLLHAISLMHRFCGSDSSRSQQALEHLVERHPRAPDARAWMAKWHFMLLPQVQSRDRAADTQRARDQIARALDLEPDHALAAALEAHLQIYVDRQPESALAQLDRITELGPNEPLGWLFKSNALALLGRGRDAVEAAERASTLSPLDPLGYFFDTFAAAAYRSADDAVTARARAERSVRANALHLPGWVQLILAQTDCGDHAAAHDSAGQYLALRPAASVQRFIDHHPGRDRVQVLREGLALREAGIPD